MANFQPICEFTSLTSPAGNEPRLSELHKMYSILTTILNSLQMPNKCWMCSVTICKMLWFYFSYYLTYSSPKVQILTVGFVLHCN